MSKPFYVYVAGPMTGWPAEYLANNVSDVVARIVLGIA